MLGLFIFSLALHFLASPAVRNQVKPVEKVAEVTAPEAGCTVQWHWSDAKFSCYRKKTLRSRVLRACGNVLDVVLLRQMLINKYTCTDSEIKTKHSNLYWPGDIIWIKEGLWEGGRRRSLLLYLVIVRLFLIIRKLDTHTPRMWRAKIVDCFSTCRLSAPQADTEHLSPGVDSQNHLGQPAGLGDPHGLGLGGQLLLDGGHHVRLGHFSGCCLGWLQLADLSALQSEAC